MTAVVRDLYIEQGATFTLSFCWEMPDPNAPAPVPPAEPVRIPRDLTGWKFRMHVKKRKSTPALVTATTENSMIRVGIDPTANPPMTVANPANGWVTVQLPAAATKLLDITSGKYDLEAESPDGGLVVRLLKGDVEVDPNITLEA